jgi:hypothetical protein
MDCDHHFEFVENGMYCIMCGLQEEIFYHDDGCETVIKPNQILSKYLTNIDDQLRTLIINSFEKILLYNNARDDKKRAILAACFFYINKKHNFMYSLKDMIEKFEISKSKFSYGVMQFMTHNPEYRTFCQPISHYVDLVQLKTNFPENLKSKIYQKCATADDNRKLSNYSPFAVCLCIAFHVLEAQGHCKRSVFFRDLGVSDQTVVSILNILKS